MTAPTPPVPAAPLMPTSSIRAGEAPVELLSSTHLNPVEAPPARVENRALTAPATDDSARAVFLAWEKLRLVYNLVLIGVGLAWVGLLSGGSQLLNPEFLRFVAVNFLYANLCYCAGPWLEGYLSLAGMSRVAARSLLFLPGLLLASVLTTFAILSWGLNWLD